MKANRSRAGVSILSFPSKLRNWWGGPARRETATWFRPCVEELEPRNLLSGATLSGQVFQTVDVIDPSNTKPGPGVANVQINAVGKLPGDSFETTTNSMGDYNFANLPADTYQVSTVLPGGYWGFTSGSTSASVVLAATTNFPDLNFSLTPVNTAIVQNLYQRVLIRSADAPGLNGWVTALGSGDTLGQVFNGFVSSSEFLGGVSPMTALLLAFSSPGQPPDPNLLRNSIQLEHSGITPDAATLNILYSQQFVNQFGDTSQLSNTQFVTFLYNTVLHRGPDTNGLNYWVTQLNNGTLDRGQVALDFANSTEYVTKTNPLAYDEVVVTAAYQGLLGRPADTAGFQYWVNYLAAGNSITALGNAFAATPEFKGLSGFTDPLLSDVEAQPITPPVSVLSRLGEYDPATGNFNSVAQGSISGIGSNGKPVDLYVFAHGWAPGYQEDVLLNSTPGNPLKVWQTVQHPGGLGTPSSYPSYLYNGVDQVSVSGLAKSITLADPNAVVLVYSWIDQSGTPGGSGGEGINNLTALLGAARSESYTQLNGLQMAEAIQLALNTNFFPQQGLIHLMGHSHGSKVATVAALALQQDGIPVAQLTTFESPEDGPTGILGGVVPPQHLPGLIGAENFLWFYMQQMNVNANNNVVGGTNGRTPIAPTTGQIPNQYPTYIDNYFSQYGFGNSLENIVPGNSPLTNPQSLSNIADVSLNSGILYPLPTDPTAPGAIAQAASAIFGAHSYPVPWYAQASLMGSPLQANGIGWSPLLNSKPASGGPGLYTQTWTSYNFQQQFNLSAPTTPATQTPVFSPFQYAQMYQVGAVQDNGTGTITLGTGSNAALSFDSLTFQPLANTGNDPNGTGLAFQFQFQGTPQPGDQLVIWARGQFGLSSASVPSIDSGSLGYQTVPLFTMNASVAGSTKQWATIDMDEFAGNNSLGGNGTVLNGMFGSTQQVQIGISLIRANGSTASVTLSNFEQFTDGSS